MSGTTISDIYIGSDIIEVDRIRSAINTKGKKFLNKVFTNIEQEYSNSKFDPSIHYAGRFAAKEAVIKALKSSGYNSPISLNLINIERKKSGEPIISLGFNYAGKIKVTISHTKKYAVATAIVLTQ